MKRIDKGVFKCPACGTQFERHYSQVVVKEPRCSRSRTAKLRIENKFPCGPTHPNWKGGRRNRGKYIQLLARDHPSADSHGYIMEHRLVMEKHLGRPIIKSEHVHHKNGHYKDNRIENLEVITHSEHMRQHAIERCKTSKTFGKGRSAHTR